MPFVKLHAAILDSSIWLEPAHVRIVWITMLAMADAAGCVQASPRGLAHRANVTPEECSDALGRFLGPDADSRDGTDGRRIEAVRGGWRLLNYLEFRNRREAEDRREYQARWWREHKGRRAETDADSTKLDTPRHASTNSTQAEAEAEAEVHMQKQTHTHARPEAALPPAAPAGRSAKREKVTAGRPEEVAADLWRDFLTLRRAKRAPLTERALAGIRRQADLAGKTLGEAIELCIERNWQSFDATWLRVEARGRASADAARRHTFKASDYGEGGAI